MLLYVQVPPVEWKSLIGDVCLERCEHHAPRFSHFVHLISCNWTAARSTLTVSPSWARLTPILDLFLGSTWAVVFVQSQCVYFNIFQQITPKKLQL